MFGIYTYNTLQLQHFYYKAISRGCYAVAAACEKEMMRRFNKDINQLDNEPLAIVA